MKLSLIYRAALATAVLAGASGSASATVQNVSNGVFTIAYDDSSRFGSLTLVGNVITFNLVSTAFPSQPWIAESLNGGGTATANAVVSLLLTINNTAFANGFRFGAFDWVEGGEYLRKEASSTVALGGQLRALNVAASLTTDTRDSHSLQGAGLSVVNNLFNNWIADARIDSSTPCTVILGSCTNVIVSEPQQMLLNIENSLSAFTVDPGSRAYISKTLGAGQFTLAVTPVPEPGTWAMLGAGLAVMGFMARRRRPS